MEATAARSDRQLAIPGLMTADEARACVSAIRRHVSMTRAHLFDLWRREGWRALGYASLEACFEGEFGEDRSYLFRQLAAARVERNLESPIGDLPESHLRPIASLPPETQREVWREVQSATNGAPTARDVSEAADRHRPAAAAEPELPLSAPVEESAATEPEILPALKPSSLLRRYQKATGKESADSRDLFQTPAWALDLIQPYLQGRIWEPAEGMGNLSAGLRERGFGVIGSDILTGTDFLTCDVPECDMIVTNPPYSLKEEFLRRCFEIGRPFALLMPVTAVGEQERTAIYREYGGIDLVLPHKRINFDTPSGLTDGNGSQAWKFTGWFCWDFDIPEEDVGGRLVFWSPDRSACDGCRRRFPTDQAALVGDEYAGGRLVKKGRMLCPSCAGDGPATP